MSRTHEDCFKAIDEAAIATWTLDEGLTAKEQLAAIIDWEIQVAIDPAVNGGQVLVSQDETVERFRAMTQKIEDCLDKSLSKYENHGTRQYRDGEYLAKNHGLL